MSKEIMSYLDYKERFFKGERLEDVLLTFTDEKNEEKVS